MQLYLYQPSVDVFKTALPLTNTVLQEENAPLSVHQIFSQARYHGGVVLVGLAGKGIHLSVTSTSLQ